jgi:ABC-2 type transport system permease protein
MAKAPPAFTIARKDLVRRLRDRSAILIGLILPLGLAGIFSLTLGGADQAAFTATYAVADLDRSDVTAHLSDVLANLDFVTLRDAKDERRAEELATDGEVDAAFVLPAGMAADLAANRPVTIDVLAAPGADIGALVAVSLARSYAAQLDAVRLSVAAAAPPGASAEEVQRLVTAARAIPPAAAVVERSAANHVYSASTFFAIGMAVFFLFFTVEFGVRGLLEERDEGTLARLLVAPIPPSSIIAGKAMVGCVVGLAATSLLVIATTLLLDATWGAPLGVGLLVLAGVFTAVAVTALVTTLAKTPAQAGAYASIVAVVGGLLGGTFFPVSRAGALAYLRFLSPQGWLMAGFQELASGGAAAAAMPAIAGTLAIGIVCAIVAWSRASRLVAG